MERSVTAVFSQPYCVVSRATPGANLKKGAGYSPCTVEVTDHGLTFTTETGARIEHAAAGSVQIITPGWGRRVGAGTAVAMNGGQWVIDFGMVYRRERVAAGKPGFFRILFGTGAPRKSLRRARELNHDFTAALLAAGASDQRADGRRGAKAG